MKNVWELVHDFMALFWKTVAIGVGISVSLKLSYAMSLMCK